MKYSIVLQVSVGILPRGSFHIVDLAEIYFKLLESYRLGFQDDWKIN